MHRIPQGSRTNRQSGLTMIELLIACAVLTFGLLAVVAVFATAIGNNGRSRVDSTATMLSQAVIEQITAVLARGGPPTISDCGTHDDSNPWNINTDAGGAKLKGAGIDFSETNPAAGYQMDYVVCNGNVQSTYDVRWNITSITGGACNSTSNATCLVTVGARPKNLVAGRFSFSLPVTMRAYVGPQ